MALLSTIDLPRTVKRPRDQFTREGIQDAGKCFLRIGDRFSSFLEPMDQKERVKIYMDEIPMGRKVLYDMEHVRTWFGSKEASDPDFRFSGAEFWRPPVGSWVVSYEKEMEFPGPSLSNRRRSHYRTEKRAAFHDAEKIARAMGCKVAVSKVLELIDWH